MRSLCAYGPIKYDIHVFITSNYPSKRKEIFSTHCLRLNSFIHEKNNPRQLNIPLQLLAVLKHFFTLFFFILWFLRTVQCSVTLWRSSRSLLQDQIFVSVSLGALGVKSHTFTIDFRPENLRLLCENEAKRIGMKRICERGDGYWYADEA